MLVLIRILILIALFATAPTFAASITYIVEGFLDYDEVASWKSDTPGLGGAELQLAITFDPDNPSPQTAIQAGTFYITEYTPATSASLRLIGTTGGSNDGVYGVNPTGLVIRNLHTNATKDFIEISMAGFDLNGKGFGASMLQIFFPNQNTPSTKPAPLFRYDAGEVDFVRATFEWDPEGGGFPGGAASYDLVGAESFTVVPDADGDGVPDASDAFPYDASETADSDGDGVGDNRDYYPNDASRTAQEIPTLPLFGLLALLGLLSLFGLRKLRQ